MMDINEVIIDWESRGSYHEVLGHRIFVAEAGDDNGLPVVFLHGYPSCSFDFRHVFKLMESDFQLVAHDHIGFGLSDKPRKYSYSLVEQAEMALALWKKLGIRKAHLVAHDYGTSVATEILALRERTQIPIELLSVTLSNGSIHIELAKLRLIQKILRNSTLGPLAAKLSSEFIFTRQMRALWFNRTKCEPLELRVLSEMFFRNGGRTVIPAITRYLDERYKFWHRWIGALENLDLPAHILWAQEDPVAVKAIGEQLHAETPGSTITRLEKLGHYPMLEDPERWVGALISFIHIMENEE